MRDTAWLAATAELYSQTGINILASAVAVKLSEGVYNILWPVSLTEWSLHMLQHIAHY